MLSSHFSFMFNNSVTISLCSFCYFVTLLIGSSLCYLVIITFHLLFDNFIIFIYLFHCIMCCLCSLSSIVIVFCFIVLCILLNDSIVIKSHFQNNFAPSHYVCCFMLQSPSLSISSICSIHFCLLCLLFTLCLLCTFWKLSMHCYLSCSSCFCWPSTIKVHGASNIKSMFFICVYFVYDCLFCFVLCLFMFIGF